MDEFRALLTREGTAKCITDLRTENERLREALDNLAEAAYEFSTLADYTVAEGIEADFVAALDDAIKLLGHAG